jgi:hypothetical protein
LLTTFGPTRLAKFGTPTPCTAATQEDFIVAIVVAVID